MQLFMILFQALERFLSEMTNTEMRMLVKEPYTDQNGKAVSGRFYLHIFSFYSKMSLRTHAYVYGLETRTKTPIERDKLKRMLDKYAAPLAASELG